MFAIEQSTCRVYDFLPVGSYILAIDLSKCTIKRLCGEVAGSVD